MPTIPTYDTPQVRPEAAAIGGVSANTDTGAHAVGEALTQGLSQAANSATQAYEQHQQQADELAKAKAKVAYQEASNDRLYNPQTGLMYKQGEDAFAASGEVANDLAKVRQDIAQKMLVNDRQRQAFLRETDPYTVELHKQIESHAGQQLHVAKVATANALLEKGLVAVANDYANPDVAAQQEALISQSVRGTQLSKEDGDNRVASVRQKIAETRLDQAIAVQDYGFASTYLAAAKEQLGPAAAKYEHQVAILKQQTEADRLAQEFVHKNLDSVGRPIEGAILAKVDEQPPGEFRQKLEAAVQLHMQRQNAAWKQAEDDRLGRSLTYVERTGKANEASEDFQQLTPQNQAKVLERRNTMLHVNKAAQSNADKEELARFSALPREDQASVNIAHEFTGASPTAHFVMQKQQNYVKQKFATGEQETLAQLDNQAAAAARLLSMNSETSKKLKSELDIWYAHQDAKNKKPPTRKEVEAHISELLDYNDGSWFFGSGSKYRFEAEDQTGFVKKGKQPYEQVRTQIFGADSTQTQPAQAQSSEVRPAPGQQQPVKYRWNKSKTKRIPVYADGAEGPVEVVNGRQ